jgi:hypothetical protein
MPATHTAPPAPGASERAFNRMYVYWGGGLVGVLFILLQYHLSDQSATALVATLAGLAAVGGYCSLAVFKTFREAILPSRN